LAALVSIGIGGMVGGGIFSVLGLTVQIAGAGAYLSFVVGGIVAALTGWSYSVLSVRIRSRDGTAVFLARAFGTGVAGPLNLLLWLSYFVMLGLCAVACGAYLAALLGLDSNGPWPRVLASAVVVGFAGLNLAGAQVVGRAESVLVYFKLAVLLVFCLGGLAFVDTARVSPAAFPSAGAIIYAGALIFLGYEGFELIANASEDAIGGVIALYMLAAFVAVGKLSPHAIATENDYALAAAARPFPRAGRLHPDRRGRGGVHLQRDQREPVRRSQVHLPDGPRRRAAHPVWPAGLEPAETGSGRCESPGRQRWVEQPQASRS
jgi:amino acid transporter